MVELICRRRESSSGAAGLPRIVNLRPLPISFTAWPSDFPTKNFGFPFTQRYGDKTKKSIMRAQQDAAELATVRALP